MKVYILRSFYCNMVPYDLSEALSFLCSSLCSLSHPTFPSPSLFNSPIPAPLFINNFIFYFAFKKTIYSQLVIYSFPNFSNHIDCSLIVKDLTVNIHIGVSTYCMCLLGSELPHSGWFFSMSFYLPMNFMISFLTNNIPVCKCITYLLLIHQLVDI